MSRCPSVAPPAIVGRGGQRRHRTWMVVPVRQCAIAERIPNQRSQSSRLRRGKARESCGARERRSEAPTHAGCGPRPIFLGGGLCPGMLTRTPPAAYSRRSPAARALHRPRLGPSSDPDAAALRCNGVRSCHGERGTRDKALHAARNGLALYGRSTICVTRSRDRRGVSIPAYPGAPPSITWPAVLSAW